MTTQYRKRHPDYEIWTTDGQDCGSSKVGKVKDLFLELQCFWERRTE